MSGFVVRRGEFAKTGKPRWLARHRGPKGRETARSFERKRDADLWLAEQNADVAAGSWIPPERSRRLFGDVAGSWLELHPGKASTVAGYTSVLNRHVLPQFATMPVSSIERTMVRRFVADLTASGLSANTVRNALNVVKGVLTYAVEVGSIKASPAAGVSAPRVVRKEMRVATEQQIAALADAIGDNYRTLIYFAAYSGIRAGEISALRVRDLDLRRGRVHVREAASEVHGRLVYDVPKSGRTRTVSVPPFLRDMLAEHVAAVAADREAFVFTTPDGGPLRQSNFYRRVFRPAADSAGLEDLRFHDLRHTCAAFLIGSGAHPRAIMERLGHSSIVVTMDTYGHMLPSLDDELTGALEDRFQATQSELLRTHRGQSEDVVPLTKALKPTRNPR